ncbi:hypothetical protein DMENIID0001_135350 [Sergentomyia squamirostris]
MTNAKTPRPPIWEASRRPMFVKSVWLDNQGCRHIILDGVATNKKRSSCSTVQRENLRDLLEETPEGNPLELVGSSDIFTISHPSGKDSTNNPSRNPHKLCRKLFKSRYSVEVLRKHLQGGVRTGHPDQLNRPGGKSGEDVVTNGGGLRDREVIVISEQSKNQLTERVLQWLDLAGKNTLVRPESEVTKGATPLNQRRIYTAEVNRKTINQGSPCLKRTESVHHLSITLNEEECAEVASPSDSSVTPRIKFGDFFPVTYRCSRKFLSHSSYRSGVQSPPTYMNTTTTTAQSMARSKNVPAGGMGGNKKTMADHATRDKNSRKHVNAASSPGGKLGKSDSIENQYRGIIHRQLLETSCNTQIAKRQLHIFMPNLPNKAKGECDSCLSTVVSSDLSKKSHSTTHS